MGNLLAAIDECPSRRAACIANGSMGVGGGLAVRMLAMKADHGGAMISPSPRAAAHGLAHFGRPQGRPVGIDCRIAARSA